jgi:hypothetical protein
MLKFRSMQQILQRLQTVVAESLSFTQELLMEKLYICSLIFQQPIFVVIDTNHVRAELYLCAKN